MRNPARRTVTTMALAMAIPAMALAAPRLEVATPTVDLGTTTQGAPLELTFEIANPGDATLELVARPTCGCTVIEADTTLVPGATGRISARVDTSGIKPGVMTKTIMVSSNDPEHPSQRLTVRAEIVAADHSGE